MSLTPVSHISSTSPEAGTDNEAPASGEDTADEAAGADSAGLDSEWAVTLDSFRSKMGVVLQDCDLLDHMTVLENVALPLRIAGQKTNALAQDLRELAAWVGLGHRLDARPPELSSGERQRAAIARSVVNSPEVVIADEPTGNVDAAAAERIMQLFVELNKLGKTVLIATHDMNLMRAAAGQKAYVLRIDKGRIERSGAPL